MVEEKSKIRRLFSVAALPLLLFVVFAVLSWLRIPPLVRNTMWAEDGLIFLTQRAASGSFVTWFLPYQGYLHLVPRIVADTVATVLPASQYANGMTALSVLVVAGVGSLVFVCSKRIVPWLPARILMASIAILIPTAPIEVLGNAANLHWYLLWLAPWLMMARPGSRLTAWLLGVTAVIVALTEIQVIIFLPLMAWRFRDRRMWFVRVGLLLGLLGQLIATVVAPRASGTTSLPSVVSVVWAYLTQVVLAVWTGSSQLAAQAMLVGGFPVLVLAVLPIVAAVAYALVRGTPEQRVMTIALVAGSLVSFAASFGLNVASARDYSRFASADWLMFYFLRYSVLPSILLGGAGIIALSIMHSRGLRVISWLLIAVTLLVVIPPFFPGEGTARSASAPWFVELEVARQACLAPGAPTRYAIPVAPGRQWAATLPCSTILGR